MVLGLVQLVSHVARMLIMTRTLTGRITVHMTFSPSKKTNLKLDGIFFRSVSRFIVWKYLMRYSVLYWFFMGRIEYFTHLTCALLFWLTFLSFRCSKFIHHNIPSHRSDSLLQSTNRVLWCTPGLSSFLLKFLSFCSFLIVQSYVYMSN